MNAPKKIRTRLPMREGMVSLSSASEWPDIYEVSATKNPAYSIGEDVTIPGRGTFVYAKSSAACISGQGCEFTATGYISITTFVVTAGIGEQTITIPAATHAALTENELANGIVVIYDGTTNNVQTRQILANEAAVANAAFNVLLDGELKEAITTSSKVEVFQNPYAALRTGTSTALAKAGVPASKVSAASLYFWVQTVGFCWIAPQSAAGGAKQIGGFFRHDGSLQDPGTALAVTVEANQTGQYAGYCVEGSAAGNGPLFKLTL
jgi:hypothetical protein